MPLTAGIDNIVGTAGNDTISATHATFSGLDSIDGGAGNDTLGIVDTASTALALPAGVTVKNVEALTIASNNAVGTSSTSYDVSGFSGLTSATITSAGADYLKAAATTDVTIKSAAGAVVVAGGQNVTSVSVDDVTLTGDLVSANVTTATTTGVAVSIGSKTATAAAADTAQKIVSATVKGGADVLVADYNAATSQASTGTLTTVTISETADTTVSLAGKALTTLNVGKQTVATAITVDQTGVAADQAFTLTVADSGVTGSSAQVVSVVNNTASSIAVTANGTNNNVKLDSDASLKSVTVTGAGKLTLDLDGSNNTALTSFDGSTATGALTLANTAPVTSLKTGAGADTFTIVAAAKDTVAAGAGNDTVTVGGALSAGSTVDLGEGDDVLLNSSGSVAASTSTLTTSVDGGAGTDVISASLVNAGNGGVFKNFEVLGLDNTSGTMDASLLTGSTITGLALIAGGGTYTNVTAAQSLTAATTTSGTTTLTFSGVTGTADAYTINFGLDNSAATAAPTSANMAAGTIVTAGIEDYTLVSGGTKAWNSVTLGINASAKTVSITGASNLDLAFGDGSTTTATFGSTTSPNTGVSLIDGSAATGKLSINTTDVVAATAGLTVKGGSAADTITTASVGGTLTGGAGNDTFDVALSLYGSTGVIATITDAAVGDKIQLLTTGSAALGTKADVSAATTLLAAIEIANGSSTTASNGVSWFQYAGNTYVVDDAGTGANVASTDLVVKLTGLVDLSTATLDSSSVLTIA